MKLINLFVLLVLTTVCSLPAMDAPLNPDHETDFNNFIEYWEDIAKEIPLQIDPYEKNQRDAMQEAKQSGPQRPFVCACGADFSSRGALAIHQGRMHKTTPVVETQGQNLPVVTRRPTLTIGNAPAVEAPQNWSFEAYNPTIFKKQDSSETHSHPPKSSKSIKKTKEVSKTVSVKTKSRKVCDTARLLICSRRDKNSFKMISDFKKHILACCTDLQPYKCDDPKCNFTCVQSNNLQRHMKTIHKLDANTQLSVDMLKKISAAINPFLPAWEFKCEVCDGLFPDVDSLRTHHNKTHSNTILELPVIITSDLMMQTAKKSRPPKRKALTLETKDSVPSIQRIQNKSMKSSSAESLDEMENLK